MSLQKEISKKIKLFFVGNLKATDEKSRIRIRKASRTDLWIRIRNNICHRFTHCNYKFLIDFRTLRTKVKLVVIPTLVFKVEKTFYVLLPYITYVMQSGRFSQCPAFLSRMAKERDKKYSVKSPQRYKK
jgi:hypothetical protein